MKSSKALGLALLTAVLGSELTAATFGYANGNVLICFRRANTGPTDLIANVGNISTFTNLAPNTKITITGFTGQQLGYIGTNNIAWTALAYYDNSATPAAIRNTLYLSSPRAGLNIQTDPYYSDTASGQGQVISKLNAIILGAQNNGNYSTTNTATAILEPESYNQNNSAVSYYIGLGNNLNFNDTFQSQPEQVTPANFTTGSTAVRADFYWMPPATGAPNGIYLGYFELSPNGTMTYTAYPSATVTTPVITSFVRKGTTNLVTFTTGSTGTYTLRGTNAAGFTTPRTNWPAVSFVLGDGGSHTLQESNNVPNKFYVITAQ
ncbi:MAG TPA: hypothetical protein VG347_00605 [Verrucomicrobiae bacterium]|nr:hypothetical protein [Verrucomicrobiae bacterium]